MQQVCPYSIFYYSVKILQLLQNELRNNKATLCGPLARLILSTEKLTVSCLHTDENSFSQVLCCGEQGWWRRLGLLYHLIQSDKSEILNAQNLTSLTRIMQYWLSWSQKNNPFFVCSQSVFLLKNIHYSQFFFGGRNVIHSVNVNI